MYIEECFQPAPGCTLITSEWVQPNTYTQHSWTPRADCDPRRAYLDCLSLRSVTILVSAVSLVDKSIRSYKHPQNCSSPIFPLVLIMPLGMACSGPNKVSPFKPTCRALSSQLLSPCENFCTTAQELLATQQAASPRVIILLAL